MLTPTLNPQYIITMGLQELMDVSEPTFLLTKQQILHAYQSLHAKVQNCEYIQCCGMLHYEPHPTRYCGIFQ